MLYYKNNSLVLSIAIVDSSLQNQFVSLLYFHLRKKFNISLYKPINITMQQKLFTAIPIPSKRGFVDIYGEELQKLQALSNTMD